MVNERSEREREGRWTALRARRLRDRERVGGKKTERQTQKERKKKKERKMPVKH